MGGVRGVGETIRELKQVPDTLTRAEIDEIYEAAKGAAAALRASVPSKPLSRMEGGPIRAHVKRGSVTGNYYGMANSKRLASVHLTGPVMSVISDMAAVQRGSSPMVPNLYNRYGGTSRWVWPTVERFMPAFIARIEFAIKRTELDVNTRLRRRV